jgi:septal ring-binding cell division protein DamX
MKRVGTETDYLEKKGYQTTVREAQVKGKKWFRVYVGEYKTREEADKARLELLSDKRIGYAMIVKLKYVKPE